MSYRYQGYFGEHARSTKKRIVGCKSPITLVKYGIERKAVAREIRIDKQVANLMSGIFFPDSKRRSI